MRRRKENLEASDTIKTRLIREKVVCSFYSAAAFRRLIDRLVQINTVELILSYLTVYNFPPLTCGIMVMLFTCSWYMHSPKTPS